MKEPAINLNTPTGEGIPSASDVIAWIAKSSPSAWFPSRYAEKTGTSRDALDVPLEMLRRYNLVLAAEWERGIGQGYKLTPIGLEYLERTGKTPTPTQIQAPTPKITIPIEDPSPIISTETEPSFKTSPALVAPLLLMLTLIWFAVGFVIAWRHGVGWEYLKGETHAGVNMALMRTGAVRGTALLLGEWWRLPASCFVHFGLFHLLGNMLILGIMGPAIEAFWGRWRFFVNYLVSGTCAAALAMALQPYRDIDRNVTEILLVGASGALCGMVASVVVWLASYRRKQMGITDTKWIGRIGVMVIGVVLVTAVSPHGNEYAHMGGYIAGGMCAVALDRIRGNDRRSMMRGWLGVLLVLGIYIGILLAAMQWSDDWREVRKWSEEVKKRYEKDRTAVACGDVFLKIRPHAIRDLVRSNPSTANDELRPLVKQLRTDAVIAIERTRTLTDSDGDKFREYLQSVIRFADQLDDSISKSKNGKFTVPPFTDVDSRWAELGWK